MAAIYKVGHFLPENIVRNDDLTSFMETSDEWISQRSGIRERRWIREGDRKFVGLANHEMVFEAVRMALGGELEAAREFDVIVYATISPDNDLPGSGGLLKDKLGIHSNIPVIEIRNQCSGFLYGLMVAESCIDSGVYKRALVIGCEIQSSGLDLSTAGRGTTVLFADGCGVAVVGPSNADGHELFGCELQSDGSYAEKLCVKKPGFAPGSLLGEGDIVARNPEIFPHMDGKAIFHMAAERMPEAVRSIVSKHGLSIDDLDLVIPHQANQRIIDMLAGALGGKTQVYSNIEQRGNTTSASIPIALSEALAAGVIKSGNLICLTTFGAGVSWGAALLRW